jgi:hypothetical protein
VTKEARPCNRPQERSFPIRSESSIASAPFEAQDKQDDSTGGEEEAGAVLRHSRTGLKTRHYRNASDEMDGVTH